MEKRQNYHSMDPIFRPLISIIIPVYNAEKYIENCIHSVFNQTYTCFELIVINDGSTDRSYELLTNLKKKYNFKFIDKANSGVSSTRNLGIEEAQGEFICFIDSDDSIENDYLEKFILNYSDESDLLIQDIIRGGKIKANYSLGTFRIDSDLEKILLTNKLLNNGVPFAKFYNTAIIKLNHIRFENKVTYGEDLMFLLNYIKCIKSITYIDYAGYIYNYNLHSASTKKHTFYTYFTVYNSIKDFIEYYKIKDKKILSEVYVYIWNFIQSALDYSTNLTKEDFLRLTSSIDFKCFRYANTIYRRVLYIGIKLRMYFFIKLLLNRN